MDLNQLKAHVDKGMSISDLSAEQLIIICMKTIGAEEVQKVVVQFDDSFVATPPAESKIQQMISKLVQDSPQIVSLGIVGVNRFDNSFYSFSCEYKPVTFIGELSCMKSAAIEWDKNNTRRVL